MLVTPNNYDTITNNKGGVQFRTVLLKISLIISRSSEYSSFNLCIGEDVKNGNGILIRHNCSWISHNDRSTHIPCQYSGMIQFYGSS